MSNVTIKYGDDLFFVEDETYEQVCLAIIEGWALTVKRHPESSQREKITFFSEVDWVATDLPAVEL
jgi:hypothetical protein